MGNFVEGLGMLWDIWVVDFDSGKMILAKSSVKKSFAKTFERHWKTKRSTVVLLPAGLSIEV